MAVFVNPLINPAGREPQDLSRETEDVYVQVEPFAYDKETGDVINSTNRPIRIKSGSVNVYEKIQSYAADCDIYSVLAKYSITKDESLLNKKVGSFADLTNLPTNIHELQSYLDSINSKLDSLAPEIKDNIFNDKELDSIIADVVKKELVARNLVKDDKEVK